MSARTIVWEGTDAWRAEVAVVDLGVDRVRAKGTQLGVDPVPYRLEYELDTTAGWETHRLQARSSGAGWSREIDLRHDGAGRWRCEVAESGSAPGLAEPGGDMALLRGAIDCDLGASPLTNLMPVRRHTLNIHEGEHDLLMAWVDAPSLAVVPSPQRYEHVRRTEDGSVVRYVGEGRRFVAELELDADGLVRAYPGLARRVAG
ncbi:putative glycolipid-binding domain-containing protein [Patulibacter sp.]|uniref:putative glycolipid-binding domain-containing protein n=1 Tax=Patulibacter sp. TaxID=1912859 RepID=UPI0027242564|nr:putative glycolipid-binding domain-containing protein [Patulibacter sp.]MDO9408832.1 putative glycolipid-binding domain-containing protein [Patulibacter sp.]